MRILAAITCVGLMTLASGVATAAEIQVAAAISLKEAMTDVAKAFQAKTGDTAEVRFGSSGALLAQIRNGAPTDVFISAADKQMDDLQSAHLVDAATRQVIARNEIVLVVPADASRVPAGFAQLTHPAYAKIAVGEPRTVPAGQYAVGLLKHLGLYEKLQPRLVYGADVRQVLAYVERDEVNAGIVYSTDARQAGDRVKIAAAAKPEDHPPINYPAAIVAGTSHTEDAAKFLQFLESAEGEQILAAHGFVPPAKPH